MTFRLHMGINLHVLSEMSGDSLTCNMIGVMIVMQ